MRFGLQREPTGTLLAKPGPGEAFLPPLPSSQADLGNTSHRAESHHPERVGAGSSAEAAPRRVTQRGRPCGRASSLTRAARISSAYGFGSIGLQREGEAFDGEHGSLGGEGKERKCSPKPPPSPGDPSIGKGAGPTKWPPSPSARVNLVLEQGEGRRLSQSPSLLQPPGGDEMCGKWLLRREAALQQAAAAALQGTHCSGLLLLLWVCQRDSSSPSLLCPLPQGNPPATQHCPSRVPTLHLEGMWGSGQPRDQRGIRGLLGWERQRIPRQQEGDEMSAPAIPDAQLRHTASTGASGVMDVTEENTRNG